MRRRGGRRFVIHASLPETSVLLRSGTPARVRSQRREGWSMISNSFVSEPRRGVPLILIAYVAIAIPLIPSIVSAHGEVGNRIFLSPIVGNDAFPDNALSLTMRRSDYEFSLLPEFEKQLTDTSSVLLTMAWDTLEPPQKQDVSGTTDLTVYFRQALLISVPHELEFTVSPFVVVPTGNRQIGDQGYTHLGGELLLGKGFGDLPQASLTSYLRPFAIQVEAGYAGRIQGPANSDAYANLELEYSLRYLDQFVEHIEARPRWSNLAPYVQLNYSQSFIASRLTLSPDFRLTPGIAYEGDWFELSAGAQIGLNGASEPGDRVAVIGLIEIFYDNIFPKLGWNPF
jgi:hypothetical protein